MRCALCPARAVHQHHLIPKQVLRREGRSDRLTDPRVLMPLCFDCHFSHESWSRRIWRDQLPASVWEFARELGEWAVCRLEQDYPVRDRPASAAGDVRA
jgi:hypothetical protein